MMLLDVAVLSKSTYFSVFFNDIIVFYVLIYFVFGVLIFSLIRFKSTFDLIIGYQLFLCLIRRAIWHVWNRGTIAGLLVFQYHLFLYGNWVLIIGLLWIFLFFNDTLLLKMTALIICSTEVFVWFLITEHGSISLVFLEI